MNQISAGDIVVHKMSKVPLFDFSPLHQKYSSLPGVVLKVDNNKSLILWESYTEWVDLAYLLKVSKVE